MTARRLLFVMLFGIFTVAGGLCATAVAEDAPAREKASDATAVSQLTAGELKLLQKRIKNWAELPVEKQERVARRVLSLRNMTDEERARLRDRIAHKVRHPETSRGSASRDRRPDMRHMWAVAKGLGALAAEGLISKDVQRGLRAKGIHGGHLESALLRRFFGRLQKQRLKGIEALDAQTLPERLRPYFLRLKQTLQSKDKRIRDKALMDMARMAVVGEVKQLLDGAPRPKSDFDKQTAAPTREQREAWHKLMVAHYRKIGEQARAKWPEAFEATRQELAAVAADLDKLGTWVETHGRSDKRGTGNAQVLRAVMTINRYVALNAGNQELRKRYDALLGSVLKQRGLTSEQVEGLVKLEPRQRMQMLGRILKEFVGKDRQARNGRRRPGGGGIRRPERDKPDRGK